MANPKVYVVQEVFRKTDSGAMVPAFDLTPAAEFGELVPLLPSGWQGLDLTPAITMLQDKLKDFTVQDYILPIGNPNLMIAAGMVAAMQTGGFVKVLQWDRMRGAYIPTTIDIPDF